MNEKNGLLFPQEVLKKIKDEFYFVDGDEGGERLFFDNSGGSLRLKACVEAKGSLECYPDCPERTHARARALKKIVVDGTRDILGTMFGGADGALITELTASQVMFHIVEIILENTEGTNAVVSSVEHPSAFDAMAYYCQKTGKELRVLPVDQGTGAVSPEIIRDYVDENTALLSVMSASNVTGSIMDIGAIVREARAIKPDLYIISDAVQHAPHACMEAQKLGLDGMNFAPYKFFGIRGCGFGYVSDRVARLPHRKLIRKPETVFELGTSAPANFLAAQEIMNYVARIGSYFLDGQDRAMLYREGMRRIHLHERALLSRLLEGTEDVPGLRYIKGVTVHADCEDLTKRDLIAAISIEGLTEQEGVAEYEKRGVIVCDRAKSSMYAERILNALGIEGAIRVSPLHCHGVEDIDKFLQITKEIAALAQSKRA